MLVLRFEGVTHDGCQANDLILKIDDDGKARLLWFDGQDAMRGECADASELCEFVKMEVLK